MKKASGDQAGAFRCTCTRCGRDYTAKGVPPMTPVCPSCREKAEKQDAAIAAKFNPKHTPALPFNAGAKKTARAAKTGGRAR